MEKKEAIKILKDFHGESALFSVRTALETLYPEFKESEDEKVRKELLTWLQNTEGQVLPMDRYNAALAWLEKQGETYTKKDVDNAYLEGMAFAKDELEKQGKQKSQRMISAEAKEAMYDKPANTVEQKCEESKTRIFDTPTPFEDKLYAFVLACEILVDPSKREFILEHSQEILDAAKEQIGKEQSSTWSKEDEEMLVDAYVMLDWYKGNNWWTARHIKDWLKSLKERCTWKPSDEQLEALKNAIHIKPFENPSDNPLWGLYEQLKKLKGE